MTIKTIFVVLHVVSAAGWFGVSLLLARMAREAAASSDGAVRTIGSTTVSLMGVFITLTFAFGLGAMLTGGGFAAYGPEYHVSMLLILLLVLLHFAVIRPAWTVVTGDDDTRKAAASKRIGMLSGIGHLVWLIVLVLMFLRYHV